MRREYFSLEVSNVDWIDDNGDPDLPTVAVVFEDGRDELVEQFSDIEGDRLESSDIDISYRLQDPVDDGDATGVVAVTNRMTGDYVCELNATAADVLPFVSAARRYGETVGNGARYVARFVVDEEELFAYEKETFLVYGPDGDLLRSHSLIPSGVEI